MNIKFYVSYEAARLLKEKGYDEATDYIIDEDNFMMNSHYLLNENLSEYVCSCPTKAEAIDWLESKGIVVVIFFDYNIDSWRYTNGEANMEYFSTRLEAEDAAIIKALELL